VVLEVENSFIVKEIVEKYVRTQVTRRIQN